MNFESDEIYKIQGFVKSLNSVHNSIIVVEGKRDEEALKKLGVSGKICQFHSFKGLIKFADSMPKYNILILLLDSDQKGRYLTKRIISQLQHRMTIDLSYRKYLTIITKGKIKNVEDLSTYEFEG
ncbi:toprim domain-containing protein [Candidatus Nitrosotalea okcheonensis]|uniref:Putative Toprim domain protein n=1 Tax=Candidatus Nitrosotalea okcheonensis TaxID=1903276 RepID=A0A2H1FFM5_9ARCH|nr:toprim domain-containing protein [Candidatus Nitrosotalea okcheonensis]SMH71557.1 putative Toprim domain protein [Candidatus Nitrosotalea okcheonensis]